MKFTAKKTGEGRIPSLIALVVIVFAIGLFGCSSDSGNKSPKVTIPAGQLSKLAEYPEGKNVFVYKKDGTIDNRPNDLEELCRDYLFYRSKVLKYGRAGMTDKAARYRLRFQEVNAWLNEYDESDVQTMFSIIAKKGCKSP